jgi:hypothetical protein
MMKRLLLLAGVIAAVIAPQAARAGNVLVDGGRTSVALDFATLETVGLVFSGVSGDVIVPGDIPDSVAFAINPRDAASLPTTFAYDPSDFLGTFSGTIEHAGSVFFNDGTVQVGNLSIGFIAERGFTVTSTVGVEGILFDLGVTGLDAGTNFLRVDADLLVSPELAGILGDSGLAGAFVGVAQVNAAAVPEPSSLALLGIASAAGGLGLWRRRRSRAATRSASEA